MEKSAESTPILSVVVPMYNEGQGVELFFKKLIPILLGITENWEIVCVNDGSKDDTLIRIQRHTHAEPRIRYLSLSRNFGKEPALTAGLEYARGKAVIPIDADLQDPPELITEMVQKWQEGYKVVLATRKTRQGDSWLKKCTASMFYKFIGMVSHVHIPENTGDYRLMDRQVVEVITRLPERTRFNKGLFAWVGFKTTTLYFERQPRAHGDAKVNFRMMWRHAKDGVFSFTTLPLRFVTYIGFVISLISFSYALYLFLRALFTGIDVPGYTSLMMAVLCIGGLQLLSIGLIGEYVGRIYRETKQRPLYVIEEKSTG